MQYIDLTEIQAKEVVPGFYGKFVHTENMTTAYWDIITNSSLPEHAHIHVQIMNLIEGEFEMEIDYDSFNFINCFVEVMSKKTLNEVICVALRVNETLNVFRNYIVEWSFG